MDAVLALLKNPVVLLAVGLVIKFVPGVRTVIANKLIPYINTILAFLGSIVGPAAASASVLGLPIALALPFGMGGPLGSLGGAILAAAQAWALNEMFVRHTAPPKPPDSK